MGWERPLKTPILSLYVKVHEGLCPTEHCGHWVCLCGGVRKNGTSVTVSPLGEQTHGIGGYLYIGDHQVPGELGPAVNEAVPVQQVHSAEG